MSAELIPSRPTPPRGAAFTTRAGGVSAGPFASLNLGPDRDDPDDDVRENRRRPATRSASTPPR